MLFRNTPTSFGPIAKFLHWLVFLLVGFMLVFGFFLESVPKEYQPITYNLHKLTGLLILALMILRTIWALANPKPVLPTNTPWQRTADIFVQLVLYVTLICMPLAGWIGAVAGGRPPHLGSFNFTLPIAPNKALAKAAFNMHGSLAIIIIVFVSIHILAAFYHYFILRDNILQRMLPGK